MTDPGPELVDALRAALRTGADPERAAGQQRYMKSAMPFLGLTSPRRREIVRPLLADPGLRLETRAELERAVRTLWDDARFREERYAALDLLRHRAYRAWRDPDLMPLVEELVVTGAWWDVVDELSNVVGEVLLVDPEGEGLRMRDWAERDDLWLRRSAIISQLRHRERTDTDLLASVIEVNLDDREFFVRKAIGWALRQYARTDPVWVRALVDRHSDRMSGLSRREALKHL
ncbi:DNA alkylation repair protein [Knoellia flava TL1]|uniref:DNA alkylation repair protein n=2 Tax=Knoellia flava TaxID=913969 RepID=A0A8H9FXN9_9MICO|nr:DNA alkylation repair protein [Knoellia flava]KGN35135.1 DNA alkylation repair protein [Knoellia flava TL1]GGB86263.1 DNA alkylation repair protein [Knoellia flava]